MSLYYEASTILANEAQTGGSLKSRIFNGSHDAKNPPAKLYALFIESLKWSPYLKEVIERSELLKIERKVRFLTQSSRRTPSHINHSWILGSRSCLSTIFSSRKAESLLLRNMHFVSLLRSTKIAWGLNLPSAGYDMSSPPSTICESMLMATLQPTRRNTSILTLAGYESIRWKKTPTILCEIISRILPATKALESTI